MTDVSAEFGGYRQELERTLPLQAPHSVRVVQPHPLVGRLLRPSRGRVLPALLPTVRREVEQVEHQHERLLAARERRPGVKDALAIAEEHADRLPLLTVDRCVEVLVEVVGNDDTHGSVQPMRSRKASSLVSGAREISTKDVSFACRCDSGPM